MPTGSLIRGPYRVGQIRKRRANRGAIPAEYRSHGLPEHSADCENAPELQVFFAHQDRADIPDEDFAPQFDREPFTIIAHPHRSCFHLVVDEEFAGRAYLLEPQVHPEAF